MAQKGSNVQGIKRAFHEPVSPERPDDETMDDTAVEFRIDSADNAWVVSSVLLRHIRDFRRSDDAMRTLRTGAFAQLSHADRPVITHQILEDHQGMEKPIP